MCLRAVRQLFPVGCTGIGTGLTDLGLISVLSARVRSATVGMCGRWRLGLFVY